MQRPPQDKRPGAHALQTKRRARLIETVMHMVRRVPLKYCTPLNSSHPRITLVKDLEQFLVSKGEEKAAEGQQKVISALEDAKLSARITYANKLC